MSKHVACVVEGCAFQTSAPTEEALLKDVSRHAAEQHGVPQITPELAAKVKAAIQTR